MRVFISHSSEERWVADRIANELKSFGVEPFLYENDVEMGAEVTDVLSVSLAGCDDLLAILTPASINRRWVSMEIGAAIALKKKIVLARMSNLRAEGVPREFGNVVSCHMNDIGLYYDQLKKRIGGRDFVDQRVKAFETRAAPDPPVDELPNTTLGVISLDPLSGLPEIEELTRQIAALFESPAKPPEESQPSQEGNDGDGRDEN